MAAKVNRPLLSVSPLSHNENGRGLACKWLWRWPSKRLEAQSLFWRRRFPYLHVLRTGSCSFSEEP